MQAYSIPKDRLVLAPIVVAPDWDLPFELMCKASDYAIGAVDECKTHLCFEFISHAILCILYPYSCKTHKISSKLCFVGLLMKIK